MARIQGNTENVMPKIPSQHGNYKLSGSFRIGPVLAARYRFSGSKLYYSLAVQV
jgi:hypothetical protein